MRKGVGTKTAIVLVPTSLVVITEAVNNWSNYQVILLILFLGLFSDGLEGRTK